MQTQQDHKAIRQVLFHDPDASVYAVLDGASISDLLPTLEREQPEYCCLYRGTLPEDLTAAAPYLVRLLPDSAFTDWLIKDGWGNHYGIFAIAHAGFRELRKHFRTFLLVKGPDGQQVYFRYYDPRVLRKFARTCSQAEADHIFGPVVTYVMEDAHPQSLIRINQVNGQVKAIPIALNDVQDNPAFAAGTGRV